MADLDVFLGLLLPVVPEAVVQPELHQLQGWLGAERVLGRHVEVVHEGQQLLPSDRDVHPLGPLLHPTLNDVLHIVGGSLQFISASVLLIDYRK